MKLIAYRILHIGPKNSGDPRYAMRDPQARLEPGSNA
jgi:hypothetical protein